MNPGRHLISIGEEVRENLYKNDINQCVRIKIASQSSQFPPDVEDDTRCAAPIWREKFEIVQACLPEPHKGVQNPRNVQNGKIQHCDLGERWKWPQRQDTENG